MTNDKVRDEILSHSPNTSDFIIDEWMRTEFALPQSLRELCEESFMRVWDGYYVSREICDGALRAVNKVGKVSNWIVHWASTPALCKESARVAVSFRSYNSKYYCVIKVWHGSEQQHTANRGVQA